MNNDRKHTPAPQELDEALETLTMPQNLQFEADAEKEAVSKETASIKKNSIRGLIVKISSSDK